MRILIHRQVWLGDLANEMKDTLKQLLIGCISASKKGGSGGGVDPSKFPSQVRFGFHFQERYYFFCEVTSARADLIKRKVFEAKLSSSFESETGK